MYFVIYINGWAYECLFSLLLDGISINPPLRDYGALFSPPHYYSTFSSTPATALEQHRDRESIRYRPQGTALV